jgi:hypothetical protein
MVSSILISAGITVKPSLGKVSGFHERLKSARHEERAKSDMAMPSAPRAMSAICGVTVLVLMAVVVGKSEGNGS